MIVLLFVPFTVPSASSLLGGRDDIFHLKFSTGRSILQAQQALKELACPFVEQFNVSGNNCATRLFKYFDFLNYPDGLYANICTETKKGPPCISSHETLNAPRTLGEESSNFSSLDGQLHQIVSTVVSFFIFSIPRITLVFIYEYIQMYAPKGLTI
ncbi:hypothetical protein Leryth_010164 [Lithospermum erythrorhizon]|nr:hypothetical protein Leryth_010164 [Lithospermum erythrorhizon]